MPRLLATDQPSNRRRHFCRLSDGEKRETLETRLVSLRGLVLTPLRDLQLLRFAIRQEGLGALLTDIRVGARLIHENDFETDDITISQNNVIEIKAVLRCSLQSVLPV